VKKEYTYILIAYVAMQFSFIIGQPLVYQIGIKLFHQSAQTMKVMTSPIWIVISFILGLIVILFMLSKSERKEFNRVAPLPVSQSIAWAIGGIFLTFLAQYVAIMIETLLGIQQGSQNTERILTLITKFPLVILVSSIVGPILEEIVFREIIFGSLRKRFSFFISGLISSIIFGLAHQEIPHLLLYTLLGFTLAFLYERTKRMTVSMFAHVTMNTIVVISQFAQPTMEHAAQNHNVYRIIGGFIYETTSFWFN